MFFHKKFGDVWREIVSNEKNNAVNEGYTILNTIDEVSNWSNKNFSSWISTLTKDEYNCIWQYSGNTHQPINSHLRGLEGSNNYMRNIINLLDNSLSRSKLQEDIITFRWDNYNGLIHKILSQKKEVKKGAKLKSKAFLSTTLLPINRLAQATYTDDEQVLLIIKTPKGVEGASIYHISNSKLECELLINRECIIDIEQVLFRHKQSYILLCKVNV